MKSLIKVCLVCALAAMALAQDNTQPAPTQGGGWGGQRQGMRGHRGRGIMGEITAVNGDGFTVKTMQGNSATVKVSSETKIMRDQQPIKITDLKVGNTIGVSGTADTNDPTTWNASFIIDRTAQANEMKANLGKTMIMGEVKAIDGTNLTVLRPDGQTQTISADENTSFKKGRESVTLADIKAGDHIAGRGALKGGVFVASDLRVGGGMGGGRGFGGGQGPGAGQGQPDGQAPPAPPQSN
jgi:riboflavin synthase alpha subunit